MARIDELQSKIQHRLNIARNNSADPRLIELAELTLELAEIVRNIELQIGIAPGNMGGFHGR